MKKITKIVSFLLVLTLLFTNCGLGNIEVEAAKKASKKPTKITLSDSKKNLAVGETFTLKVKSVKPANASKSVTWSSSRNKIATVSKKGKVKAKKTGSVTITAKSTVSKKVVAKCKIKVYKATKTLKLNSETSYELTVGQTQQLSAKVTNPKKGAAPIEWSSSDKKVAKVTSKGNVTAVAEGKAIITAKSGKKKVTVSIVVKKKETGNDTGNTPGTQNPGTGGNQPPGDTTGTGGTQNPGTQPGSGSGSGNTKPEDGANDDATSGDETVSDNTTTDNTDDDNNPTNGDTSEDDKEKDEEEEENSIIVHSGIWNGMVWSINGNGKLSVSGNDIRMEDVLVQVVESGAEEDLDVDTEESDEEDEEDEEYKDPNQPEWIDYNSSIKSAVIDVKNVKSLYKWFYDCSNLISVDLSGLDTSDATNMSYMFYGCRNLAELEVSRFNTSNVADMSSMFGLCRGLTTLNVDNFDTTKVSNMSHMFYGCDKLEKLDLRSFDTSNVENMWGMFDGCKALVDLDVSEFDTRNVTQMGWMFLGCSGLTSLDVSGFNTGNVIDIQCMFQSCTSLTSLDLSTWNLEKVAFYGYGCTFTNCTSLVTIQVPLNVCFNCSLDDASGDDEQPAIFVDVNGNTYTSLPQNITESFEITRLN